MAKEKNIFLLEINPRFSSSTSMRRVLGFNESKMAVDFYLTGKLPDQPILKSGSVIRYIEDFYIHE
jgi:carbamoyl-phosphate synthase large subunit